jgi:hypothetical protein
VPMNRRPVMVAEVEITVKLCETGVAARYEELRACEAWIVQVPRREEARHIPRNRTNHSSL